MGCLLVLVALPFVALYAAVMLMFDVVRLIVECLRGEPDPDPPQAAVSDRR